MAGARRCQEKAALPGANAADTNGEIGGTIMTIIWHLLFFAAVVFSYLLQALVWLVIANAVVSWLIAFDIINMRNRTAYSVVRGLDRVVSPVLKPFRRFIPPLGGMDITPLILIVLIAAAQQTLVGPLIGWLHVMSEGGLQS